MTTNGGEAAGVQPKKKSGCGGCAGIALTLVLLYIVLIIVSCNNAKDDAAEKAASQPTFTGPPVITGTLATKVKNACIAQVTSVAQNAAREIAGVKPKVYSVKSTSFSGPVEEISLLHEDIAYEVNFTYVTLAADGTEMSDTRTCRVNDSFDFVELRR